MSQKKTDGRSLSNQEKITSILFKKISRRTIKSKYLSCSENDRLCIFKIIVQKIFLIRFRTDTNSLIQAVKYSW